jgi:O-antigen ligase
MLYAKYMQPIIAWTFYLLTILLPLTFTTTTYELFEFPKFLLLLTGTLVVSAAWLYHAISTRDFSLRGETSKYLKVLHGAVLAVAITQTITTLTSLHPATSFWGYYSRFHQGLLTTWCYTILYFAGVKWLDKENIQKIIKISLRTSFFIAIIAVLEHYNLSLTCLFMTMLEKLKNGAVPLITSAACWGTLTNPHDRSFATLGQPNWLAAYLLPHLFLALQTLHTKYKNMSKVSYVVRVTWYVLLYFFALLFTKSRSGFLAFGLSLVTYWLLTIRLHEFSKIKNTILISSFLFLASILLLGSPFTPPLTHLRSTPTPPAISGPALEVESTESGDIRKIVWTGAWQIFRSHPLLGTGPETFAYTYYNVRPAAHNLTTEWDYLYNKAHNEYLNFAANSGLLGLSAYLAWHLALLYIAYRGAGKKLGSALAPILGVSIVSFTVTNFFGFSVIPVYFTLILFSLIISHDALGATSTPIPTRPNFLLLVSIFLFLVYLFPYRFYRADLDLNKGKAYLAAGQPGQAVNYLTRSLTYRDLDLTHSYLAEAYATLAATAYVNKDPALKEQAPKLTELSLTQAEITRTMNQYHLNYYKSRAKVYLSLATIDPTYYTRAIREIEQALALAPTDAKLAYNLGLVETRTGDYQGAETAFTRALTLKPNYADAYYAQTLLYEETKQTAKIPALLQDAVTHLATASAELKNKIEKYVPNP